MGVEQVQRDLGARRRGARKAVIGNEAWLHQALQDVILQVAQELGDLGGQELHLVSLTCGEDGSMALNTIDYRLIQPFFSQTTHN